ncbi:MAG TPA: AmmeMemoRadiSam system protein A [Clostridia bacterium]
MKKNPGADEDPFVAFARAAVLAWINDRKLLGWNEYADDKHRDPAIAERMKGESAGAFVSLHLHGLLRGCIGTIEPIRASLAEEISSNAVSACSRDPRFSPVRMEELDGLEINVDILHPPVPHIGLIDWDVRRYGVIVAGRHGRRGILLPDLEGVDSAAEQMSIAMQKAGLSSGEVENVWIFEVERHD